MTRSTSRRERPDDPCIYHVGLSARSGTARFLRSWTEQDWEPKWEPACGQGRAASATLAAYAAQAVKRSGPRTRLGVDQQQSQHQDSEAREDRYCVRAARRVGVASDRSPADLSLNEWLQARRDDGQGL